MFLLCTWSEQFSCELPEKRHSLAPPPLHCLPVCQFGLSPLSLLVQTSRASPGLITKGEKLAANHSLQGRETTSGADADLQGTAHTKIYPTPVRERPVVHLLGYNHLSNPPAKNIHTTLLSMCTVLQCTVLYRLQHVYQKITNFYAVYTCKFTSAPSPVPLAPCLCWGWDGATIWLGWAWPGICLGSASVQQQRA